MAKFAFEIYLSSSKLRRTASASWRTWLGTSTRSKSWSNAVNSSSYACQRKAKRSVGFSANSSQTRKTWVSNSIVCPKRLSSKSSKTSLTRASAAIRQPSLSGRTVDGSGWWTPITGWPRSKRSCRREVYPSPMIKVGLALPQLSVTANHQNLIKIACQLITKTRSFCPRVMTILETIFD